MFVDVYGLSCDYNIIFGIVCDELVMNGDFKKSKNIFVVFW